MAALTPLLMAYAAPAAQGAAAASSQPPARLATDLGVASTENSSKLEELFERIESRS
jgi:hypothetical protein